MPERIVERKPRPRDRVLIRLSGGRFFALPKEAAAGLEVGVVLSGSDIERLSGVDQYVRGRDRALRLLAVRARSRREIEEALRAIGVRETIRAGVVRELEETGLVDDARFAREYVSVKKEVRRLGPRRLRRDLSRLGIPRAAADEALSGFGADEQEGMARALVERRVGDSPPDEKMLRRVIAMLKRRGYDHAVVGRVAYDLSRRIKRGVKEADLAAPADE
jgi:regulatory protein